MERDEGARVRDVVLELGGGAEDGGGRVVVPGDVDDEEVVGEGVRFANGRGVREGGVHVDEAEGRGGVSGGLVMAAGGAAVEARFGAGGFVGEGVGDVELGGGEGGGEGGGGYLEDVG